MNVEVRRQEKIEMAEERDFRRGDLLGRFTVKMLYGWNNGKFEKEYLRKSNIKITESELSFFPIFLFLFSFPFDLFLFPILELRVRVSNNITSHIIHGRI